ncbi:MATE family efflux transporter [Bacillus massiliigorillae]|uniref:MATE family efflux transporter n=1 Tax=Bacillus massiliigorillae TaxID=1243664 RepID=UPI00039C9580|nr:MATE family efflux transporter [Bacillus massiliigorillae]
MTETSLKLRETPVTKLFLSYLIPSVLGMLLMSVNILVDGIFVSHGVGEDALAGVNIAVPIFSIFLSISLWIGMGGATLYSISLGRNEIKKAQSIFTQSFVLAISIVGVLVLLSLWKETELAYFFGANERILPYVLDYLHIILLYGIVFVFENVLSIFIRNDGNPKLAMIGLIITSVLNIIFNYVFIFIMDLGISGAAYATVLATFIGFLVMLTHFLRKNSTLKFVKLKFEYEIVKQIMTIGFPSFIVESSAAILTMGYNITFMHYTGELGVTAFAVVNYIHVMFLLLFLGVGAALQPIASFHFGAKLFERLRSCLKLSVRTGIVFGLITLALGVLFADFLVSMFGIESQEVRDFTVKGIALFFISYLFLAYNLVYAEYYQAIRNIRLSIIIILTRSIFLLIPLLWLLPKLLGVNGIWLAFPVSEGITTLCLVLWHRGRSPVPQTA